MVHGVTTGPRTTSTMMKISALCRLRWLVGSLLIAAAALFAIGVRTEGDVHHDAVVSVESGEHNETTETSASAQETEPGATIFGISLESTPLVVLAAFISLVLAAATWRSDHQLVLLVTALFAAAFAALDVAELSHQITVSAGTIAVVAAIIAVLHAAAALLAAQRRAATS